MTLELGGRKVVVTGEERELARTIAEALADVVIWIREWKGDVKKLKQLLPKIEAQIVSERPNGTSSQTSLWRQTISQKSYW